MIVVGVDGCPVGWVAARVKLEGDVPSSLCLKSFRNFEEVVDEWVEAAAVAVDIPIGLIECQRAADIEARAVLGGRKSSVFPAPDPRVIDLEGYREANQIMQEHCEKGISKQAFAIFPKVREVNEVVRRRDPQQQRIIEIHPEACFWALNAKRPLNHAKRTAEGYQERRALLQSWLAMPLWDDRKTARNQAIGAAADDVLDAIAAAWTAQWWAAGCPGRFPVMKQHDAFGLCAEIVY